MSRKNDPRPGAVVPAQVSFLTVYNPSLGNTDETLHDQIVFYFSQNENDSLKRRDGTHSPERMEAGEKGKERERKNERLRQIGLAQGMVEFARSFSDGEALDSVETEKSRVVLHELERGWWILASIDLTRLPSDKSRNPKESETTDAARSDVEFSAREVCPPGLLLQHLLRAHSIFLLHHAPSLDELYVRLSRDKFCSALSQFWTKFVWNWDVLLHGNPAVDAFHAMKLAPGGELGIGVGEEDWGSGERAVLEGFIDRIDGMVDLVVSRFGDAPEQKARGDPNDGTRRNQTWARPDTRPGPSDGIVFSGVKAVSRESARALTSWTEWIYMHGETAYGVQENPNSALRNRPRRPPKAGSGPAAASFESYASAPWKEAEQKTSPRADPSPEDQKEEASPQDAAPGIPPPIVSAAEASLKEATDAATETKNKSSGHGEEPTNELEGNSTSETFMKYLTLGYGSSWRFGSSKDSTDGQDIQNGDHSELKGSVKPGSTVQTGKKDDSSSQQHRQHPLGSFLIGLKGDLDEEEMPENDEMLAGNPDAERQTRNLSNRISLRTVHMEVQSRLKVEEGGTDESSAPQEAGQGDGGLTHKKLRVVVYMCQPFIYTFLFELRAPALAISSFYRSIHQQLHPLHRPLVASTSQSNVSERLSVSGAGSSTNRDPIYDLIYDPKSLTVHSSIPNIPEPGAAASTEAFDPSDPRRIWSRVEALNVHTQILNTWTATRGNNFDLERTCKTTRGWWIVWMRLPASRDHNDSGQEEQHHRHARSATAESREAEKGEDAYRQAFLVRKSSDYEKSGGALGSWRDRGGGGGGGGGAGAARGGWTSGGKLAEGIGVDTRKYIEGLLSLSR